ncbi:transcription factor 7-like 2 isoform X3 [Lineus longissimus]|uniref:transcription factor 7-like 2 isoform X3 n=1 Tax=Lineus longissimus TaxID=88925 RepID=UPI00315CCC02
MPHVNSSGGDDLASTDEVKVYKDEGEEEKRSSENLSEDKLGLVTESEEEKGSNLPGQNDPSTESSTQDGKSDHGHDRPGPLPGQYVVTPYPYPNGATVGSLGYFSMYSTPTFQNAAEHGLVSTSLPFPMPKKLSDTSPWGPTTHFMGNKVSVVQPTHPSALAHLMMYNNDSFTQPPPAHMGIPPVSIDPKTGLPRPPMYPIPPHPSQYPHPIYSPEFSQVQWQGPPSYPVTSTGYRGPYPSSLVTNSTLRFGHPGLIPPPPGVHHSVPHPAIITPGPKQEIPQSQAQENHRYLDISRNGSLQLDEEKLWEHSNLLYGMQHHPGHDQVRHDQVEQPEPEKKKPHIKKPLNAFMLFMKEMRAQVVAECTLKESAAINQILGRKWHTLDRSEQAKYYDMARKEKELHMQLYPGWSARDNYSKHSKRKKRKRASSESADPASSECTNPKKCRARFGVEHQGQWCKPCRRKKKCIRFLTDGDDDDDDDDDGTLSDTNDDSDSDNPRCNLLSEQSSSSKNLAKADSTQPESSSPVSSPEGTSHLEVPRDSQDQTQSVVSSQPVDMQPTSTCTTGQETSTDAANSS